MKPGDAIARLSPQIKTGLIAGIDRSHTMLIQASRRNSHSIKQGLIELHQGKIWDLPYPDVMPSATLR